MDERAFETIRLLPRHELEAFAHRAMLRIRRDSKETEADRLFRSALVGFLIGALVTAAGFLAGTSLN